MSNFAVYKAQAQIQTNQRKSHFKYTALSKFHVVAKWHGRLFAYKEILDLT